MIERAFPRFGVALAACRTANLEHNRRLAEQLYRRARKSVNRASRDADANRLWNDSAELQQALDFLICDRRW